MGFTERLLLTIIVTSLIADHRAATPTYGYYSVIRISGIFPTKRGVSWEGHLFGLLAGIATAFLLF